MRSTNEKIIKAKREFNRILIQAILEGLDFGEIVLRFMELNSQVKRSEMGEKPELFAEKLEEVFGSWTANIFEERILRILSMKIGIEYSSIEDFNFSKAVKKAFREFLKSVK
ncbi:hypothetical protein CW706_03435 [Candidatus Bathyarchaeota archaeon]|nr:MAG: hypothetical protein CW706_03435 [Candidatus Bathyarchaeota archaeon]